MYSRTKHAYACVRACVCVHMHIRTAVETVIFSKSSPYNRPRRPGGWIEVQLNSSFNLGARWGVGGQHHAPAALPPEKTRYPLYKRLGGPQGRSGRVRKISPSPGFDSRTPQPVASRYTDWAIAAHVIFNTLIKIWSRLDARTDGPSVAIWLWLLSS